MLLGQRDPKWVVHYENGKVSERMDKSTALNYMEIFPEATHIEKVRGWWKREIYPKRRKP